MVILSIAGTELYLSGNVKLALSSYWKEFVNPVKQIYITNKKAPAHECTPEHQWQGALILLIRKVQLSNLGSTQSPVQWVPDHFPRGKVAGTWRSAVTLPLLWAFMACYSVDSYLLTSLFTYLFIYLLTYSLIYLLTYLFTYLFIYLLTYLLT